jgi:twitching motility two-component system response regulator PilG
MATRLLAMLERVATEELGYAPALAIEAEETSAGGAAGGGAGPPARLRALVVDDSLPVRTQMKLALRDVATHVDFAENSDEAEAFIRGGRYDVVFLDVILPGKDGYELCRMIKQDAEKRDTSVIMLTSNSSPADRIKGKLAGCDTYLIKPVRNAVFQEVLGELADTMGGTGQPSGGAAQAAYGPAWRASHSNA